ncbi:MAG: hypothetical protein WD200_04475 [Candidatus Andersenbacteria bacterium]
MVLGNEMANEGLSRRKRRTQMVLGNEMAKENLRERLHKTTSQAAKKQSPADAPKDEKCENQESKEQAHGSH